MFPTRSDDQTFVKPHIEVTAECYKFLDRGYIDSQLLKRSIGRVKGDERKKSDKINELIDLGVSSPNEIVKVLNYAFGFPVINFNKEQARIF